MKRYTVLIGLVLTVGACTPQDAETTTNRFATSTTKTITSTTRSTAITTTTLGLDPTTTTTMPSGPPVAWIAPSGVPMAVTAVNGDVIHVLTPCGAETSLSEGEPIHKVDVVLDPGHGGPIDTGAVGSTGLAEKDVNLRVALEARDLLTDREIAVMLTRTGDYPIPIRTRSAYSDMVDADALVSIHHNAPSAPSSDIPGVEIFIQEASSESMRLGGLLYESTMSALAEFQVDWARASDAGVMTVLNPEGEDAYGMVRLPEAPSALIELGYIANRPEAELQATAEYVGIAALAVADAVEAFLDSDAEGSGFVEGRVFRPNRGVGADQCIEPDLQLQLYPDVIDVEISGEDGVFGLDVTISSPYDSADRYADAWRVVGDDGVVYGVRELTHDHGNEQPFTRSMDGVEIPETVSTIVVEGRDQVYGWGGTAITLTLP